MFLGPMYFVGAVLQGPHPHPRNPGLRKVRKGWGFAQGS